MKRRWTALLLALVLLLSLTACGGEEKQGDKTPTAEPEQASAAETAAEEAEPEALPTGIGGENETEILP